VPEVAVDEEQVKEALAAVNDPEIGMSIMDLGLVYDIAIDPEDNVSIEMTLTSPGCPLGDVITQQVDAALKAIGARSAAVDIVWSPPWTPDMMSEDAKERLGWGIR
jgi:metal-sulfur cluster biosynthetic enzyme